MRIALLGIVSLLAACSTAVPLTPGFPEAPAMLKEKCPELKIILGEKVSIVDFTKTVSENYTTYYQCAGKNDAWIDWYNQQKKIWEELQ
jgi:hypothetical protein